jgi:trehalose synthase
MDDVDENALIVNALQRHAALVVQKSLAEGFGLTLTEAMWKGRPVVASAVGGLQDQMTDGVEGFLLRDAADLDAFGSLVTRILDEPALAATMGRRGQERVRRDFLGDRHLVQWVELLTTLQA